MKKKLMCLFLAAAMTTSALAGCGNQQESGKQQSGAQESNAQESSTQENSQTASEEISVDVGISFPLENQEKLTYWLQNYASASVDSYEDMGMYKALQEITNVDIEFIHPSSADVKQQFNLMVTSKEMADIVEEVKSNYQGGLAAAYNDGLIIDIMEYIDYAPNLKAIMDKFPAIRGEILDENGRLLAFPSIRGGEEMRSIVGLMLNEQYLEDLDLEVPETIEDWTNVLRAFKENGVQVPFSIPYSLFFSRTVFSAAYDLSPGIYVKDGKVTYGPYEDAWEDYITLMHEWYAEGLIDQEIMTRAGSDVNSGFINGDIGAIVSSVGGIGGIFDGIAVSAPYPSLDGTQKPYLNYREQVAASVCSVTTACENPELAVQLLDYMYSYDGMLLANFGIEGESYNIVDGLPQFTEIVTNHPEGKSMSQAGLLYARSFSYGPFVQDKTFGYEFYGKDAQKDATEKWTKNVEMYDANNPTVYGSMTDEEKEVYTSNMTDIQTYVEETTAQFIMGTKPLDEFEEYFAQIKTLGIEDVLSVKQQAYDRHITLYPELLESEYYEVSSIYSE